MFNPFGNQGLHQWGPWPKYPSRHHEKKLWKDRPIEPCKVYVGNLNQMVTGADLKQALSFYADVKSALIITDRDTGRSKGYGFASVKADVDVEKLLRLKGSSLYLHGRPMKIQRARKQIQRPKPVIYTRPQLSDRPFDLEPSDPAQPTVHVLVDDVLLKIFKFLPLVHIVRAERVCRRWQMLVYSSFAAISKLELDGSTQGVLENGVFLEEPVIAKLLILAGNSVKELHLTKIGSSPTNILDITARLCPVIERLYITDTVGVNEASLGFFVALRSKLKVFSVKNCCGISDNSLRVLLKGSSELESLDIEDSDFRGQMLAFLPATLKELRLVHCQDMKLNHWTHLANCPNLEVFETDCFRIKRDNLEALAKHCPKISTLKIDIGVEGADEALGKFENLKVLSVSGGRINIHAILDKHRGLESLSLDVNDCGGRDIDLGVLKDLKEINFTFTVIDLPICNSLKKCKSLEKFSCSCSAVLTWQIVFQLLRSCPLLNYIYVPGLQFNDDFKDGINETVKNRENKVTITARSKSNFKSFSVDKQKVELKEFVGPNGFLLDYDSDDDSNLGFPNYDDDYLSDNYYDGISLGSGISYDEEDFMFACQLDNAFIPDVAFLCLGDRYSDSD